MSNKIPYIPEIDGLRALAVLPVIFFHLGASWIPGGFMGVDVFFVISGFLITAILINEVDKPRKTYFFDFYLRRLRRIFPVFFTVVLVTLFSSYFFILPSDYLELGRSAVASGFFLSNVFFYFNTGYFDAPAETMPLLHTWSLAVEEQFYFVWPAFILFLSKLKYKTRNQLVFAVFFCSLFLSVIVTPKDPALAFYNFPFRVFEFLLGAIIPISKLNPLLVKKTNTLVCSLFFQIFGFLLIIFSFFYFSKEVSFPGWRAVVPSLGASLFIIGATMQNKPRVNLFASPLIVGVGKISFSLYLWHWPVVTLFKIYSNCEEIKWESSLWLLMLITLLSIISFQIIEKPLRTPAWQKKAILYSASACVVVICMFLVLSGTKGFSNRVPDPSKVASLEEMWKWDCPSKINLNGKDLCNFGVPWSGAGKKIILWGDSHAEQLAPLFELIANKYKLSFVIFPSCRPVTDGDSILIRHRNPKRSTKGCYESMLQVFDIIEKDGSIDLVVIAGAWLNSPGQIFSNNKKKHSWEERMKLMCDGLSQTVEHVLDLGPEVLLLGDTPHPGKLRGDCALQSNLFRRLNIDCGPIPWQEIEGKQGPTEKLVMSVAQKHDHAYFHSIIDSYCSDNGCQIYFDGEYIFRDGDHIKRNFSNKIKSGLCSAFGLNKAIDWADL